MRCGTPVERAQRVGDRGVVDPRSTSRGGRRGGVLAVVRARDERLGGKLVVDARSSTRRAAPGTEPNPRGTTAVSSAPCALEDAELRVRVRLERAVPVEVVGLEVEQDGDARTQRLDVLELERRELAHDPAPPARPTPTRDVSGRPTLPATSTGVPADRKTAPSSSVVVVLPFVPVTPRIGFGRSRAPSSISLHTGTRALARARDEQRLTRDSRALHDEIDPL